MSFRKRDASATPGTFNFVLHIVYLEGIVYIV